VFSRVSGEFFGCAAWSAAEPGASSILFRAQVLAGERLRLLELPLHEFNTDRAVAVRAAKII
jgi:hypothetical protein